MYNTQSKWTKTTTRTSERNNKQHLQVYNTYNAGNNNNNNNNKGRDGQSPAPSPRPKRPTGRPPPEGPDSDPIRIRAARELIKKIQIVTLNDDLGFYRPANWVNPTEKPTPP